MGRKFIVVSATAALLIFASDFSLAQGQPKAPGPRRSGVGGRNHGIKDVRERWFQLPPEERQVFQRNAERWLRMSPAEQKLLREREKIRSQRLKNEAEIALRQSGLHLDQQKRDLFEDRYLQERRKVERELRREVEAKRQQQLPALQERLKREFQETSPETTSASTPAVSATPKK